MPSLHVIGRKIEFSVLLGAIIIAGALYGFVEMIEVARDSTPHSLDTAILLALREPGNPGVGIGPYWLPDSVRDITALGSVSVLAFIVAATVIFLIIEKQVQAAVFVFLSVAGGQIVSSLLKHEVDRPRPDVVPHLAEVHTMSFPSGHAMLSAVTYLTLGALLARVTPNRAVKIYLLSLALVLTMMVGASRVYLGVHWPSDVFAGWCAGAAWAMLCWLIAQWVLRRGETDQPSS